MKHFLLVYDRVRGQLVECQEYEDYDAALKCRFVHEHGKSPDVEVVVLSATSEANLWRTHVRYFKSFQEQVAAAASA
jgi:hypothetical protein